MPQRGASDPAVLAAATRRLLNAGFASPSDAAAQSHGVRAGLSRRPASEPALAALTAQGVRLCSEVRTQDSLRATGVLTAAEHAGGVARVYERLRATRRALLEGLEQPTARLEVPASSLWRTLAALEKVHAAEAHLVRQMAAQAQLPPQPPQRAQDGADSSSSDSEDEATEHAPAAAGGSAPAHARASAALGAAAANSQQAAAAAELEECAAAIAKVRALIPAASPPQQKQQRRKTTIVAAGGADVIFFDAMSAAKVTGTASSLRLG